MQASSSFFGYSPPLGAAAERLHGRPLAPIEDIAVMKLIAVSQRGARKDFFDLHEVLKTRDFRGTRHARAMLAKSPVNPLHSAKSLVYAEQEPNPTLLTGDSWATVKDRFVRNLHAYSHILVEELAAP